VVGLAVPLGAVLWLAVLSLTALPCPAAVTDEHAATMHTVNSRHATRRPGPAWLFCIRPNVVASQRHGMVDEKSAPWSLDFPRGEP